MKKLYLFTSAVLMLFITTAIHAQTLNQPANWPNTNWTLSGTYDVGSLIADPTVDPNFSYDDDNAGSGSTDILMVESPVIDLTAANTAGENNIFVDYDYNYNLGDIFDLEYWDADASAWQAWDVVADNSSTTSNWCGSLQGVVTSTGLDISAFTANQLTNFQYRFNYDASSVFGYGFCMASPTIYSVGCLPATNLNASNITQTTVDIDWTDVAGTGLYNIEWGAPGYTPGTGAEIGSITGSTNNPETISGLNPQTEYDIYIQTDCGSGDVSNWTGPINITTLCGIQVIPYVTGYSTFLPLCWDEAADGTPATGPSNLGGGVWTQDDFLNQGGNQAAKINLYTTGREEWLISPEFDFSTGGPYEMELIVGITDFASTAAENMGSDDEVQVLVTTDGGTTWSNLFTWTQANQPTNTGSVEVIDLTSITASSVQFAIWATDGTVNDAEDYDFFIDQFEVREIPTCPDPINLNATNITQNSVDIDWTDVASVGLYNIEWGAPGFTAGTGNEIGSITGSTNNPETITGLMPNTQYDIYIQADCGSGDFSNWTGPISINTLCGVISFPYHETFEDTSSNRSCWTQIQEVGAANWTYQAGSSGGAITGAYTGTLNARFVSQSGTNDPVTKLVSPVIDLSSVANPVLYFAYGQEVWAGDQNEINVYYRISDSDPWVLLMNDNSDVASWTEVEMALPNPSATYQVAFEGVNNWGRANVIDDVIFCEKDDASFTLPSELCDQETAVTPNVTGVSGGNFSGSTGLTINSTTGEIDPSASGQGTFEVYYNTNTGACSSNEDTLSIEVVGTEDATFMYDTNEVCSDAPIEMPTISGVEGGTFSAGTGLDIDPSTGAIDPSASNAGSYTVEYTSSATACASTEQFTFDIIEVEDASFDYGGTEFCLNYEDIVPTVTGETGGTFSAEPGLAINTITGQIGAEATTPGTYWVYYMTPGNNNCPAMDSVEISVDECLGLNEEVMNDISLFPNPAQDIVNYVIPEMTGDVTVKMVDATGKVVYTSTVSGTAGQEEINISDFENGMYFVTFDNEAFTTTKRLVINR